MSKSDQNAKVSDRTNERDNQKVTSLTIIPEQPEKDDKANMVEVSKTKSQKKNGLYWEDKKNDQSVTKQPIQRENIRYY
jgi:hypothetical protein